jgi:peptidoglycan/LPS O-acetylase OafA/YrhL
MPASTDRPSWIDRGRIPSLDGVRGIAILLVVFAHVIQTNGFPAGGPPIWLTDLGALGVDAFFVLSGFLITTLMLREFDRSGRLDRRGFYRRRALRILPAYVTLLIAVASLQLTGFLQVPRGDWLGALTFTMNFRYHPAWELGHVWSLSIEEHFYVVWPLVVSALPAAWRVALLVGCLAACFAARWVVLLAFPEFGTMAELWTFTRLDTIASGCLLAVLACDARRAWLDRAAQRWAAAAAVVAVSFILMDISWKWRVGIAHSLNNVCIAILIWTAAQKAPRWLNGRRLVALGIGSYSIYLWQQVFLNPHRDAWFTRFPQNLVLASLLAFASYRLIETPFLRLKERGVPADVTPRARSRA